MMFPYCRTCCVVWDTEENRDWGISHNMITGHTTLGAHRFVSIFKAKIPCWFRPNKQHEFLFHIFTPILL